MWKEMETFSKAMQIKLLARITEVSDNTMSLVATLMFSLVT